MKIIKLVLIIPFLLLSCKNKEANTEKKSAIDIQLEAVEKQLSLLLDKAVEENRIPRTTNKDGSIYWAPLKFDWTEGFFPGTCWYLYEVTKDEKWKNGAEQFQKLIESHKTITSNHDLGFIFNCSFGNGYRLTKNKTFKEVLIASGNSLITRFNEKVGCIQSWDVGPNHRWRFPVIIDNMMNLELLFELTELTGDTKYKDIAIIHADTTMKYHFRDNYSSYHVIDYDPETGEVRNRNTAQGFSDDSSWARGQAWGLYGYTVCYRYTKDEKYLEQAQKIANYIINSMPEDGIPYWDYNAPDIPNEKRDVSAAAIATSALIELGCYTGESYMSFINKSIKALGSEAYSAKFGENNNFALMHSVGSIPHNAEVDVPLNYADYYYVEALLRLKSLE
ncbi:glycoside hydrolase family 88 protein [Flavivirga eckloniae]|uniref:Glucuronyl hydrolase n=1 Tax=Flavivirga eckloniae TaxID=1803846 RepID=A0A2K9PNN3_9FLAO|nr:glycoside hydrolase family 88 protein [Flavivirga eckloniae]AUP78197.1 glucuronyl hydrolase [Flavivirga eckloniae]